MEIRKILKFIPVVVFAVLMRTLPHPPNLAPIGALALFAGANLTGITAYAFPLSVMFLSDIFLGFHSIMPYVYLSFVIIVFIGRGLKLNNKVPRLFLSAIFSSIVFFVITNFGVWFSTGMYSKNPTGLINCYLLAIPFFRNTIIGDFLYTFLFFYGYQYSLTLSRKILKLRG